MEAMNQFAARLDEDEALRARLKGVKGKNRAEIVRGIAAVAQGAGIELSLMELERAFGGTARPTELGLKELEKVSGGGSFQFDSRLQARLRSQLDERVRAVLDRA